MPRKKTWKARLAAMLAALLLAASLTGCGISDFLAGAWGEDPVAEEEEAAGAEAGAAYAQASSENAEDEPFITLDNIPEYTDSPVVAINGNVPFFTDEDKTENAFESYSDLDSLGRCGAAYACIGEEIMPTDERGDIGSIKPSGWHTVKYDGIDGNYLYNRCHLIAYSLSGENDNEKNLITGTRYMNTEGMLPYEERTADYIHITGHHVLYRVTPIFEGDNLLASGVLMEAKSVEDDGICFCVYCYNVQPGITIDYATGDSTGPEFTGSDGESQETGDAGTGRLQSSAQKSGSVSVQNQADDSGEYILNTNTMKFHRPDCPSVSRMSDHNKEEYTGSRETLIAEGYEPCGNCNP